MLFVISKTVLRLTQFSLAIFANLKRVSSETSKLISEEDEMFEYIGVLLWLPILDV